MSKSTKPKPKPTTVTTAHTMPCGLVLEREVNPHYWKSYMDAGRSIAQEGIDHARECVVCRKHIAARRKAKEVSSVEIA